jgi:flagellin-like hook-associated protein FlgL
MNISGISTRSSLSVQALVNMRHQLDDLQRQLGTGKKADTYAGMGLDRGLLVSLRNRVSTLEAFQSTIDNVDVRLNLAQTALGRLGDIRQTVKSAALQATNVENNGITIAQSIAHSSLGEMLGLLNTQVGDRYLFSGLGTDQESVATLDEIMDGDGIRAGFKQIISERRQADLGPDGRGRLVLSAPSTTSVQIAEETPATVFGFKLWSINSALTNATTAGPAGVPPAISVDFTGQPNTGETIEFRFTLPDGTNETVALTATTSATPGPNEFTIGATADDTATNLQAVLGASIEKLAGTALVAASAVVAGDNFFNGTPQRVDGPPFDTATGLVAGTAANTVMWYTGENGPVPARSTATARVDTSITVSYGMRANEEGIRWAVQNVAVLAAVTYSASDPDAQTLSSALHSRIGVQLSIPPGTQTIENIEAEIAGAQGSLQSAADRHQQVEGMLSSMMEKIEGVPTEQVASEILALQTRLQASLQTTALLYQTSLVNYL